MENYDAIDGALKSLLPASRLDVLGRAVRFVQRLRCIEASRLVWAVVLSRFSAGRPGFAAARQCYERLTSRAIEGRPFQLRLKQASACTLFERAFESAVAPWRAGREISHELARRFTDIVAVDSTQIAVHDSLSTDFKGLRNVPAQIKAFVAISAFGLRPLWAKLTPANISDQRTFPPLNLFRTGTLWLFDKGFVAYARLHAMIEARQFFLCPMKQHGNPVIVAVHSGPARLRKAVRQNPAGLPLRSYLPRAKAIGRPLDLQVLIKPWGTPKMAAFSVRLVIVPGKKGDQQPYLTNLPPTQWAAEAVRELYRLRWQIELTFKELKQHLSLEVVPTRDPNAAQTFIWASLIALAVSRVVAACAAPLQARRVGLAAVVRLALVSRALRRLAWLLGRLLATKAQRVAAEFAVSLIDEVRREARAPKRPREDSFARLQDLLVAPAKELMCAA